MDIEELENKGSKELLEDDYISLYLKLEEHKNPEELIPEMEVFINTPIPHTIKDKTIYQRTIKTKRESEKPEHDTALTKTMTDRQLFDAGNPLWARGLRIKTIRYILEQHDYVMSMQQVYPELVEMFRESLDKIHTLKKA